ncbi:MAG: HAD family phosphatase [Verrucomicrobia bacterium]|nr:HAD family phosphatase [Verrucomicrobiota bacterium]
MNHKAIIFDCDGTLVDSEYAHYLSWQYALQNQGSDLSEEEYAFYVGKGVEANARLMAEKIGSKAVQTILHDKMVRYFQIKHTGLPPISSTIEFIHRLALEKKSLGLKFGLASAAPKEEILSHLSHLGIGKFFDIVLSGIDDLHSYSDPEGVNKPKPYIYLHAAKELGVSPQQCVVIEDSATGVTAGVKAGCITIAVPNRSTRYQDLSHAHLRIESFGNIGVKEFFELIRRRAESQTQSCCTTYPV